MGQFVERFLKIKKACVESCVSLFGKFNQDLQSEYLMNGLLPGLIAEQIVGS